jgi:predicted nucleic acid-binding Zn ribbon protein
VPVPPDMRRECDRCGKPLPPRKKRFCSDPCRVKAQKTERVIENRDYANGVVRLIRRMGARADGDLDALVSLAEMIDRARDTLALAVDGCRARGYSDGEIGAALGTTRQAVGQRFGRKREVYTGNGGGNALAS